MTSQLSASDRLTAFVAGLTDAQLVSTLRVLEVTDKAALSEDERAHRNLVRSRLITEVEHRWPAADAAVEAAFDAWEAAMTALQDGEEAPADVDYVAVLLAAVPVA